MPAGPLGADAWLPASAPPRLVVAVAALLVARGALTAEDLAPAPVSWRRKSDMVVGNSPAIRHLLRTLDRVAPAPDPFMIAGEPGTGKALVAQAVHFCGPRSSARFTTLPCAGLSEHVLDEGLANGGTLVLDEIGDLAHPLQTKLLRAIEHGSFARWGSRSAEALGARVIATTTRPLEAEMRGGGFNEHLGELLGRQTVQVLPLRDRIEDIPPIVHHHLALIARRERQQAPRLTPQALERLLSHGWPGNVRELVDTVERAFLMAEDGLIDGHHVVLGGVPVSTERLKVALPSFRDAKSSFEYEIYDALRRLGLNATAYRSPMAAGGG
jgi:DNA-binding NtrC family response regulator